MPACIIIIKYICSTGILKSCCLRVITNKLYNLQMIACDMYVCMCVNVYPCLHSQLCQSICVYAIVSLLLFYYQLTLDDVAVPLSGYYCLVPC